MWRNVVYIVSSALKEWYIGLKKIQVTVNGLKNTSAIINGETRLLYSSSVTALSSSIKGLNIEQAKLALSTKHLTSEQMNQVLVDAGLIATNDSISASLVKQALASTALSTVEQEQILIKAGLMDSKTKELLINKACNKEKIIEVMSAKGVADAEIKATLAKLGLTSANNLEAASWDVLNRAIKRSLNSFKTWLLNSKIGTALIITASVFAISKAYDALTESAEEATKRLEKNIEKTTSEYDKLTSSIEDINKRLEENTNRIEEINALDKPTYVEKQELDKLKQVNTYLDENKKLLEESQKASAQKSVEAIYDKFQTDFYTNKTKTIDDVAESSLEKNLLKVADFFTGGTVTDYVITKTDEYDTDYEELTSLTKKIKELKNAQDELVQSGEDTIKVNPFTSGKWKDGTWIGGSYNYEQLTKEISKYTNDITKFKSQILTTLNEIETYDPNYETQEAQQLLDLLNHIEAAVDFDSFGKKIANRVSTTSDFSEISKNISAKIKNGILTEENLLTDADGEKILNKIAEEMVKAEGSVEFSKSKFEQFGEDYLREYEEAIKNKVDNTDYLQRAASYIISVLQDETSTASKGISYSPSDIFALEDIEGKATKLGEYSEQLDKIQAAYDALTEACENYSKEGYITIDQLQALLSNGSQFLDYLIDEDGNLRTDTEAMQNLTQARLIEMEAQIQQGLIDNVTGIKTEADASTYLASTNYELANSYREVASAALDAWKTNALENGLGQNTIDRVMNKYQTDSNKVHSLFEKANIGVMSDFGNSMSSKSSSSSSKDKESSDIIDFAEYKLDKLNKLIDDTKENIDQLEGSLGKNTLIDGLIDVDKNKLNTLQSVSDLYQQMADKYFAKIPDTYRELAKNGGMNITEFVGDGNEEVIGTIENYQEWADKVDDVNSEILELQQTLKDLQVDKFNNIKDEFDDLSGIINTNKSQIKDVIDLLETQGKTVGSNFYETLISQTNTQIGLLQEERNRLNEQMNSALANGITIGSDEWNDMYDSLKDVDSSILSCKKDIADFQKSIDELHWDTVDNIADTFSQLNDEIGNIIDLLNVDKVSDKNGEWTDDAVTNIGLLAQQYELARNKAETYGEQIRYLTDEYNKGLVSESDYYDKLYELQDAQWDSIKTYEDAKDAIVELNKTRVDEAIDAINEEIDAYEEMIQRQKDALSAEKALNDYKKSIAEKEKDIATLRRKLNAMLGSDDASTIAEREKLEAELADKVADLENFKYEHSIEVQQEALDKELESYKETQEERIEILEDSLNDEEKLIADSVKSAKQNANTVAKELQKVAVTHGIAISSAVIEPWKSGVGAVAYYGSALTSQTSVFQSQLNGIKSNLWNVQIQANTTADSLMDALNINSASVNGTIDMVRNNLSNAVSWANQLKNCLLSAINSDYGSGAINSIYGVSSAANAATGSLNAMIQAASAANAATNAIAAGLNGIHGYVVKTGAGAQISGVFGNKQEAEAYANSHGAYVRQIFAKGGVVSAGGKIDPVARELGEDVTVHVKEGERILTPVQNKLFEKFVNNMPNLVPVMENMKLPKLDINSLPVQRNMELKPVINIDAGITVEGSIDKSFAKDFESMQNQLTKNVTNKIANSLVKLGVQRNCCRPL